VCPTTPSQANTQEEVNEKYITPSVLEKFNLDATGRSSSSSSFSSISSQDTPTENANLSETTDDSFEYMYSGISR